MRLFYMMLGVLLLSVTTGHHTVQAQSDEPFVTVWKTDNEGSSNENQITIPGSGTDYTIEWVEVEEDNGTWQEVDGGHSGSTTGTDEHTVDFPDPGTYQVSISGDFTRIFFGLYGLGGGGDEEKIIDVVQWGDIEWSTMSGAFRYTSNLNISATDAPDLSQVSDVSLMFHSALSLNADIGHWDTGNVEDMTQMFNGAESFNGDIGDWNTENVTSMRSMFRAAVSFNQDIGGWNTGSVNDMAGMFWIAESFNGDIGDWDTGQVTDMWMMFREAGSFDQDLGNWNTGNVTNMSEMFRNAESFNGDIGHWDTGNVEDMSQMFHGAESFNGDIGDWNTKNVTSMRSMFSLAQSFNQDLGNWGTGNVTNMNAMFRNAESFNGDIGHWDTGNVENMSSMFSGAASFNQDLGDWDVSNVGGTSSMGNMLDGSGLSVENYDNILTGWAQQQVQSDVTLGASGLYYCHSADDRQDLITDSNWSINDEGESVYCEEPGAVVLRFPENEARRISLQPELRWDSLALAQTYDLTLSPNEDFSDPVVEETGLTDTSYTVSSELDLSTDYFWRVRAMNFGGEGTWSEARFTTVLMENGSGTEDNPYQITDAEVLDLIREDLSAHYILTDDISLSFHTGSSSGSFWNDGDGWKPLGAENSSGEESFEGSLDGSGHRISGMSINRPGQDHVGLFARLGEEAEITTLGLEEVDITGGTNTGALAGYNEGSISYSYVTGSINGNSQVGGFTGVNTQGSITHSYTKGDVSADEYSAGGMVGDNNGTISETWSSGSVEAGSEAGGLIGRNFDGPVSGNYWNSETSGTESGVGDGSVDGITALTPSEMRLQDSFEDWNFDDTWKIDEEESYPFLQDVEQEPPPGQLTTDIEPVVELPEEFGLDQNYPNPFNPATQIRYAIPEQSHVRLTVYDALGRRITTLVDESQKPGTYEATFDASELSSGVYLYRLAAGNFVETHQMMLVK